MNRVKNLLRFIGKHSILILSILIALTSGFLFWVLREEREMIISKPRYHFYFITQNSVDPLWKEVRQGAESAARQLDVAVEFNHPRFNNPQEELKYLDIAVSSYVDGIITHVSSGLDFTGLINKAYDRGIPVVTIENDDNESNRRAFIGTNSYQLGKAAADLMIKGTGGKAQIAIIVSSGLELDNASQNLKLNGFLSTIKAYPEMKVVKTYTSQMGILSAEEIAQSVISSQHGIDAIFTTSSVDTVGTAQVIVDHNRVGSYVLVGYGDTKAILRYIDMGIIYGTVMSDPYRIGYESVRAMMDIKEKNNVSTFIDTGVKIITKGNLAEYEKKADAYEPNTDMKE